MTAIVLLCLLVAQARPGPTAAAQVTRSGLHWVVTTVVLQARLGCPALPAPEHGRLHQVIIVHCCTCCTAPQTGGGPGDRALYSCLPGFSLLGTEERECQVCNSGLCYEDLLPRILGSGPGHTGSAAAGWPAVPPLQVL